MRSSTTKVHLAEQHCQAFALAAASSTDNFVVGLSLGLGGHDLSMLVLWGTATCNALGALLATASGDWMQQHVLQEGDLLPSLLASSAFAYLAWKEYRDSALPTEDSSASGSCDDSSFRALAELALPMTLNNLAGGVAGGVVGVSAVVASFHVWVVSVLFMWLGYRLGRKATKKDKRTAHSVSSWSILLYGLLSFQSFLQVLNLVYPK